MPTEEAEVVAAREAATAASPRSPRGEEASAEEEKAGADYAAAGKRKNRQVIMAESYDPTGAGKVTITRVEKSDKAKATIRAALQGGAAFLFSSLSADELETVVMAMSEKNVTPGETVIKQGDKGDFFYVVDSGTYSIFVNGTKVRPVVQGMGRWGAWLSAVSLRRDCRVIASPRRNTLHPTPSPLPASPLPARHGTTGRVSWCG